MSFIYPTQLCLPQTHLFDTPTCSSAAPSSSLANTCLDHIAGHVLLSPPLQLSLSLSLSLTYYLKPLLNKVLKTSTIKELEKELIFGFPVGPEFDRWSDRSSTDGRTGDVINNLIIIYLNYINN